MLVMPLLLDKETKTENVFVCMDAKEDKENLKVETSRRNM
jgi:hypothetical protein